MTIPPGLRQFVVSVAVAPFLLVSTFAFPIWAAPPPATVTGTISTLDGKVRLPGVIVTLLGPSGEVIGGTNTDAAGRYTLEAPKGGLYRLKTSADGFHPAEQAVRLAEGATRTVDIDLTLVEIQQTVNVTPTSDISKDLIRPLAPAENIDGRTMSASAMTSGSITAELRWLPGVSAYGREWAIKGGRPNQIGLQVESAQVMDPAAGISPVQLPGDAVNSIQVLANPYAVEFGRFSTGVIVVSTRSGSDKWSATVNDFLPSFIVKRGANPFAIIGIEALAPRAAIGGPLVRNKLFLAESAQFRYESGDVASRPQNQRKISTSVSSFTRLDYVANQRNTVTGTFTVVPENAGSVNLDTFNSPEVTADLTQRVYRFGVSDTAQLPHSMVLDTLAHFTHYGTSVDGHGSATTMVLEPERNTGIYYSRQDRESDAAQVNATLSAFVHGAAGEHLVKGGVDATHAWLDSILQMRPIDVLRENGTLARQLLAGPATARYDATDLAAFVQDRWRVNNNLLLEIGARVERDGVFGKVNFIPRVGAAIALDKEHNATVRGGWGYFYERTPLMAGVFTRLSDLSETAYGSDGQTPLGPPVLYAHTIGGDLQTPRSRTWNVGYEHRISPSLSIRANHLERDGCHELVLNTWHQGAQGVVELGSGGTSRYRDTEVGAHLKRGTVFDMDLSYTHSSSLGDLNDAYRYFLDLTANPIVRPNAFGPTDIDSPHRFVGRGWARLWKTWIVELAGEIRSGYPYSAVNEELEFVGARNSLRFPVAPTLDASIEHRFRVGRFEPWIGVVVRNVLNSFAPIDVQRNTGSPEFGYFYGSPYRAVRIIVHFHP